MKNDIKELIAVCNKLTTAIENFPQEKRDEILFGDWSIKDSIAHINGWNLQRIKEINQFINGEQVEKIYDFDALNEVEVNKRKGMSWDDLLKEFKDSCSKLIDVFNSVDAGFYDVPIWQGSRMTIKDWLRTDIDHMKGEHLEQLSEF